LDNLLFEDKEMKMKNQLQRVVYGLVVLLFLLSCGPLGNVSLSTANIADARLTKDREGTQTTTTFAPDNDFYLQVNLANAPDGTKVKAAWTAVAATGADPNTPLDDVELIQGSGMLTFDLTNDQPWPVGEYKVDLYLNDKLDRTLTFRVTGGLAQPEPQATPPAAVAGPVNSLDAVKSATIQIEAQGTFVYPQVGTLYNVAGRGSGFIIDPSGLAVTNNHVVTGAALLKVWVGGESQPRNARILGVSECADLALIDIDGDGFSYLEWYPETVDVGLDVYAAGFPLGDPEYTLTRGIISKARADGETNWASVDNVIGHDAVINPGNSGGPLVTAQGKLVGINYAGSAAVSQYFAISETQAKRVLEELQQGRDYLSIGINGTAVSDGQTLSGIWVSSVKSGSPADVAGVRGGDIITRIEGLVLATDGTMADYCDILRTRNATDVMAVEVLRFASQEVLEGQLNGRALVQTFSFAQQLASEVSDGPASGSPGSTAYDSYQLVTDESGLLTVEIPTAWGDVDGSPWLLEGEVIGLSITAAPRIADFNSSWTTPGLFFGATDQFDLTMDELLDFFDYGDSCGYDGRYDYEDGVYFGLYDLWVNCGGTDTKLVVLGSEPADRSYLVLVMVQVVTDADLYALDYILNSFIVAD
jgi:serine protease Do